MFSQRFVLSKKALNHKCFVYYVSPSTPITQPPVLTKKATSYLSLISEWKEIKPKLNDISSGVKKRYDTLELSVIPFPVIFNIKCQPALPRKKKSVKKWRLVSDGEFFYSVFFRLSLG